MENFEKCIVAMLGRLCSQHVTGNTSRLYMYQPQRAIMDCQSTGHETNPYSIVPFNKFFSPGDEQPEQHILAHTL